MLDGAGVVSRWVLSVVVWAVWLGPCGASAQSTGTQEFEVVNIKPFDRNGGASPSRGFVADPGGRIHLGYATVEMLLYFAYDVERFQISGAPDWAATEHYDIQALPPDSSPSRAETLTRATPTSEQRTMLQKMLADRFALRLHHETRQSTVYVITRGTGKLLLHPPERKDLDARCAVLAKSGGIVDGEAFGQNISMEDLVRMLTGALKMVVVDETGLTGRYDFHLPPNDPENRDYTAAVFEAMQRLGLKLKRGAGSVDTIVIDHVERPSEN